jgi:hypothetical protein
MKVELEEGKRWNKRKNRAGREGGRQKDCNQQ